MSSCRESDYTSCANVKAVPNVLLFVRSSSARRILTCLRLQLSSYYLLPGALSHQTQSKTNSNKEYDWRKQKLFCLRS